MSPLDEAIQHLQRGRSEVGMVILQKLREETPDEPVVLYNLGMVYSDMGLMEKAISTLEACVAHRGESNDHVALGVAYFRNKQAENAVAEFEAALREDSDNFYALRNFAATVAQQKRLDEAIHLYERALKINGKAPDVLYELGLTFEQKGDFKLANIWYQKVLDVPGNHPARDLAKDAMTRIVQRGMRQNGLNMDAVFYMIDAIEMFEKMPKDTVEMISFDIGLLGQRGLDINSPEKKYRLKSMGGEFSGLQLLSYMYAGLKMVHPVMTDSLDLGEEYDMAVQMRGTKE